MCDGSENNLDPFCQLDASLNRITHTHNGHNWLGGDFDARFVDWSSLEVSPSAGSERPQNQKLIDLSLDHNLDQVADQRLKEIGSLTYSLPMINQAFRKPKFYQV